jgi:hypothetical protein
MISSAVKSIASESLVMKDCQMDQRPERNLENPPIVARQKFGHLPTTSSCTLPHALQLIGTLPQTLSSWRFINNPHAGESDYYVIREGSETVPDWRIFTTNSANLPLTAPLWQNSWTFFAPDSSFIDFV